MNKKIKPIIAIMLFVIIALFFSLVSFVDDVWVMQARKARILIEEGSHNEGIELYQSALKIAEETIGSDNLNVAEFQEIIGVEYQKQGKYAEAEPFLKRSLEILEKIPDLSLSRIPLALNRLSLSYLHQGKYEDAEPLLKRALKMVKKDLNVDDPLLSTTLYSMALLYRKQLKINEAASLLKRSIKIQEENWGTEHHGLADSLSLMGILYNLQGNHNEAILFKERALKIWKISRNSDDPLVIGTYKSLVRLYNKTCKPNEAARVISHLNTIKSIRKTTDIKKEDRKWK